MFSDYDHYPIILDGATGTNLQKAGLKQGECVERWIIENSHVLEELQRGYVNSGSQMLIAPTFSLNEIKLKKWNLEGQIEPMCAELVAISKAAADGRAKVGGNIAPLGVFVHPAGDYTLDEIYNVYSRQVRALEETGIDYYIIETMMTMAEARMALLAVKENSKKPVIVSMSVNEDGKTLSGVSAFSAFITLQSMGVDGFGLNCSTGPKEMLPHIEQILPYANIPIYVKPNAGMPKVREDGSCYYDLSIDEFVRYSLEFAKMGVKMIGGCCGTTPDYIAALSSALEGFTFAPAPKADDEQFIATTEKDYFFLDNSVDTSDTLECGEDIGEIFLDMEEDSCDVIKVAAHHIDDVDFLSENFYMLSKPLCIETQNIAILEAICRLFNGRIIIENKYDFEMSMLEYLIKKYGLILL